MAAARAWQALWPAVLGGMSTWIYFWLCDMRRENWDVHLGIFGIAVALSLLCPATWAFCPKCRGCLALEGCCACYLFSVGTVFVVVAAVVGVAGLVTEWAEKEDRRHFRGFLVDIPAGVVVGLVLACCCSAGTASEASEEGSEGTELVQGGLRGRTLREGFFFSVEEQDGPARAGSCGFGAKGQGGEAFLEEQKKRAEAWSCGCGAEGRRAAAGCGAEGQMETQLGPGAARWGQQNTASVLAPRDEERRRSAAQDEEKRKKTFLEQARIEG